MKLEELIVTAVMSLFFGFVVLQALAHALGHVWQKLIGIALMFFLGFLLLKILLDG